MFITILSILYLALAVYILVRFLKSSSTMKWKNIKDRLLNFQSKESKIDDSEINEQAAPNEQFQPEFKRS